MTLCLTRCSWEKEVVMRDVIIMGCNRDCDIRGDAAEGVPGDSG